MTKQHEMGNHITRNQETLALIGNQPNHTCQWKKIYFHGVYQYQRRNDEKVDGDNFKSHHRPSEIK